MGRIGYDLMDPNVYLLVFNNNAYWTGFYRDIQEDLPPNIMYPRYSYISIYLFVGANHAVNVVTRRSHTGIIMFIQNTPIIWFSKKQNTVKAATFASNLVALSICKCLIFSFRYKLQVFGVILEGPAYVFYDNCGVVKNTSIPELVIHNKQNTIKQHSVREAVSADILLVGKEDGETNLADLLTKVMAGQKRWYFCYHIFH